MKTLPTLAAALLAALVVLGPTTAFAATTLTVSTAPSYSGTATITITGTVTPTPTIPTNVVLTISNPAGQAADFSSNSVSTTNGGYTYSIVAGGNPAWNIAGTYTVKAQWQGGNSTASASTSFQYSPTQGGGGGAVTSLNVQVTANTPTWPGQTQSLAVLVSWNNGSLACDKPCFTTVHFYTPAGNLVTIYNPANASTNPVTVHRGFFIWSWKVPAGYGDGLYAVHAWASLKLGTTTYQGQGLSSFTINSKLANQDTVASIKTSLDSLTAAVSTLTSQVNTITTSTSSIADIKTSLDTVTASLTSLSNSFTTLSTKVDGLTSTMSTVQSNLSTLMSDISSLQSTITSLGNLSSQITSLQNAISSNQTYVLVVAALAAITLVLELAILVRKLS